MQNMPNANAKMPPPITQRRPTRSERRPIGSARQSDTTPLLAGSQPIVSRPMPRERACSEKFGALIPITMSASTITRQIAATSPGIRNRRTAAGAATPAMPFPSQSLRVNPTMIAGANNDDILRRQHDCTLHTTTEP